MHKSIAELRDLDEAERWYRRSLELREPSDIQARGKYLTQLGSIAYERFSESRATGRPGDEVTSHLAKAAQMYHEALEVLPSTAIDRGVTHNQLGSIYESAGDLERAMHHFQQAIRFAEQEGNSYSAGNRRFNLARLLFMAGRLDDARAYAAAALANYLAFDDRLAAEATHRVQQLIADLDQAERQEVEA